MSEQKKMRTRHPHRRTLEARQIVILLRAKYAHKIRNLEAKIAQHISYTLCNIIRKKMKGIITYTYFLYNLHG